MPQETHDQQEAQTTGGPPAGAATTGQAGLLVVVIAGAVFMFALIGLLLVGRHPPVPGRRPRTSA